MLREKGEVKLTGAVKVQGNNGYANQKNGFSPSIEAAFAPGKHVAVIASYYRQNKYGDDGNDEDSSVQYTGKCGEIGAGYYTAIGRSGIFEILGGMETGSFHRHNLIDAGRNFDLNYHGFFIQPTIGVNIRDIFHYDFGLKYTIRRYTDFRSPTDDIRNEFTDEPADITSLTPVVITFFNNFSLGYKFVTYNIQTGIFGVHSDPGMRNTSPIYLSFGVTFSLAPRYGLGFWGNKKAAPEMRQPSE